MDNNVFLKVLSTLVLLYCHLHGHSQQASTFNLDVNEGNSFYFTNTVNTSNSTNQYGYRPTNDVYYNFTTYAVGVRLRVDCYTDIDMGACITLLHPSDNNIISQKYIPQNNPDGEYLEVSCLPPGIYSIIVEGTMENGYITTSIECTDPMEYNIASRNSSFEYKHLAYTDGLTNRSERELWYRLVLDKEMDLYISNTSDFTEGTCVAFLDDQKIDTIASMDFPKDNDLQYNALCVRDVHPGIYYVVSKGKEELGAVSTRVYGVDIEEEQHKSYINSNNYIKTITYKEPTQIEYTAGISYFDGLGMPVQTIEKAASPSGMDIVSLQEYDNMGRESNAWLPTPVEGNGTYVTPMLLKETAYTFYDNHNPFSTPIYECSPQNRVEEHYGPGIEWREEGKSAKCSFLINEAYGSLSCLRFNVLNNNSLQCSGNYPANELSIQLKTDEDGRQSLTFTDKLGRDILQRTLNGSIYDTYYVYDNLGNLRYVLPPAAADILASDGAAIATIEDDVIKDYAYYYEYDGHNNCILKKLPGCEPIYMKYDKFGKLIFSQDGNQRNEGVWSVNLYDAFGRPTVSGIWNSTSVPSVSTVNCISCYCGTGNLGGYSVNFNVQDYSITLHTVNYYDDYQFLNGLPTAKRNKMVMQSIEGYDDAYPSNAEPNAKGMLTGSRVYQTNTSLFTTDVDMGPAIGNFHSVGDDQANASSGTVGPSIGPGVSLPEFQNQYSVSVNYYDDKGQIIQSHSSNQLGGFDDDYYHYSFTGKPLQHKHVHSKSSGAPQTEVYAYTYDHAERLLTTTYSFNDGTPIAISENSYDEVGRLTGRTIPIDSITYTYNLRGWTTNIESQMFSERLYYNEEHNSNSPQYGGNISAADWSMGTSTAGYTYQYDDLSRLTQADFYEDGMGSFKFDTRYGYDKMGNMLTLERNGRHDDNQYDAIDDVVFTYRGNQLIKAVDDVCGPFYVGASHFIDGNDGEEEYSYDANGNLTKDLNKNILAIQYNYVNLPKQIVYGNGNQANYTYDAMGQKQKTEYYVRTMNGLRLNKTLTRTYCGNYIYENNDLVQVLFDGGYITFNGSNAEYHYYIQDHLGNNRIVAKTRGVPEQTNHYYPFGSLMGTSTDGDTQRYKYNGKELDRMNGLDLYDYGARFYDGIRFTTMDPLAEKYYSVSPYAYCANNPISFVDPDGCDSIFSTRGKFIGDDGKNTGDVYCVKGKTKRAVKNATKRGEYYSGDLNNLDEVAIIPRGDAALHVRDDYDNATGPELGGCRFPNGDIQEWDPGTDPTASVLPSGEVKASHSIFPFKVNGKFICPENPDVSWHIHTKLDVIADNGVSIPLGLSEPSTKDYKYEQKHTGSTFVIGQRDKRVQYYHNGKNTINISWKKWKRLAGL